jgi:site-specific recombinase XerD
MSAIIQFNPTPTDDQALAIPGQHPYHEQILQAIAGFYAHISKQKSDRTPEQHTRNNYTYGLRQFLDFMGNHLPTPQLMDFYIAHLMQRGLATSTINSGYLAPARLFCRKLATLFLDDSTWYNRIRAAVDVKGPPDDTTTNIAPAYNPKFKRLSLTQANACLRQVDRSTIAGLRDYALLHLAFTTGLRLAELQAVTLASLTVRDDCYLVSVRGKRSNYDPVPLPTRVYRDLLAYVTAYNDELEFDDPRRIGQDTPLWQPLLGSSKHVPLGHPHSRPRRGMSKEAIRGIIARRTRKGCGIQLAAHDTRRTCATIHYEAGMPLHEISALLRHKDISTTLKYLGLNPLRYDNRVSSRYVTFG